MAEHVIVRFKDAVGVPYQDGVWNELSRLIGPRWDAITLEFGTLPIRRVFREDPPAPAQAGRRGADHDRPEPYFDVELPDLQSARNFIQRLKGLRGDVVDEVYPRGQATLARGRTGPLAGTMGVSDGQGYLRPGPHGIDAVAAWNLHQAHGEGVTILDIERGWYLKHRDLPQDIPIHGKNASNLDHGVGVMGIIRALHSQAEVKGGAPQARAIAVSYAKSKTEDFDRGDVIRNARRRLAPGDILLLEFAEEFNDEERGIHIVQAPAESKRHIKGEIRRCTDAGIIVIEPAGNSGADLDSLGLENNHSGALIVGASTHDGNGTHRWEAKEYPSNYGSRINCFAWGHDIRTLGEPPDRYQMFSRTSGAAAIIAVAAALLQSIARPRLEALGRGRAYLNAEEMLEYLSDPDCGTRPEVHDPPRPIGVMPSLGLVIERFFEKNPLRGSPRPVHLKRNQAARPARAQGTRTARPVPTKLRKK